MQSGHVAYIIRVTSVTTHQLTQIYITCSYLYLIMCVTDLKVMCVICIIIFNYVYNSTGIFYIKFNFGVIFI